MTPSRPPCPSLLGPRGPGRVQRGWLETPFWGAFGVPHRCLSMDVQLALRHLQLKRRVRSHCRAGRVRERRDHEAALGALTPTCTPPPAPGDGSAPDAAPPGPRGQRP